MVLLNLASRQPLQNRAVLRQFCIVRSTGFDNRIPEPLFVSLFHPPEVMQAAPRANRASAAIMT